MISIITAVHNGLAFNRIFEQSLRQYTVNDYELIIIDNASTDGSREFFEEAGHVVIRNEENYSYPVCQNQGIAVAKGSHLFFLNNDLLVCPGWDAKLIKAAETHDVDIISACGIENAGTRKATQKLARRWKRIKYVLMQFGFAQKNLERMYKFMYGNWELFCERRFKKYGYEVVEGMIGNNVMMTRKALTLMGLWDERIQAADFDLFMRTKKRSMEEGDIKPCHIALGVYIHHYVRMTAKYAVKAVGFANKADMIEIKDKWSAEDMDTLHPENATIRRK